jgi:hypothetical protein
MKFFKAIWQFFKAIWQFLSNNSEQIKLLSGLVVAAYVLYEYLGTQEETKVARALSYITAATKPDIMTSRVGVILFAAEGPMSDITSSPKCTDNTNCKIKNETATNVQKIVNANEKIKAQVHDLMNVYYDIAACGLSEECDTATICTAFFPEIQNYYLNYKGYLQDFQRNYFGKFLQIGKFVDFCDEKWARYVPNNSQPTTPRRANDGSIPQKLRRHWASRKPRCCGGSGTERRPTWGRDRNGWRISRRRMFA